MATALPIDSDGFRDALVILGAAGVVIPAFHRLKVTPVIGFILVGAALGPSALGGLAGDLPWLRWLTISNAEAIAPFAEIGIILLLFSIGLELSVKRLWAMRSAVLVTGAAEVAVNAALLAAALYALGRPPATALALGFALALSSTALVLQLVGVKGPVGRPAFAMLLFEDLALVPIIIALGALSPLSEGAGGGAAVRAFVAGGAVVAAILVVGRKLLPLMFAQAARTRNSELMMAAILLVVIGCSLLTTLAGLSPIVGALVAGMVIAETAFRAQVEVMIEPIKNIALGVFLISVGMSLDFAIVAERWPAVMGGAILVIGLKAGVTTALLRAVGAPPSAAVQTGFLMASPSETTLIVLTAGVAARVIPPGEAALWQIVTALGLTFTPLLAQAGRRVGEQAGRLAPPPPPEPPTPEEAAGRVIVLGFGRVGRVVASMLEKHGMPYVAVDGDPDLVAREARGRGRPLVYGDASRIGYLRMLDAGRARALVVTLDRESLSAHIVRLARTEWPGLTIIARARDASHAAMLYEAGATDAVPETIESSLQLSEAVLVDIGLPMGRVIASIHERRAELRAEVQALAPGMVSEPSLGRRRARDGTGG